MLQRWGWRLSGVLACVCLLSEISPVLGQSPAAVRAWPEAVQLSGNWDRAQLTVAAAQADGQFGPRSADLTSRSAFVSSNPAVVAVDPQGRLLAVGDGQAVITISVDGQSRDVPVSVGGVLPAPQIGFMQHVMPILSKAGCNAGACHASQFGKGGFKLSVFGYAPNEDREQIARDLISRRVDFIDPTRSLFLRKPTLETPHGGNRRLEKGSVDYQILCAWIASGAPGPTGNEPKVTELRVSPERRVGEVGLTQQLQVTAVYSDGVVHDVTHWTKFDSTDDSVARVTTGGLLEMVGRGQGGVMARFEGQAYVVPVIVPYATEVPLANWQDQNFIDTLAAAKFRELGIEPSPLCDDATFLRRVYFDVTGTLPTPEQAAAFLDSPAPDKRSQLIDELLGLTGDPARDTHQEDYAAYWTLKWADLLRCSSAVAGEQGMWALHNWIRDSFRTNKPFSTFVQELVTAQGSAFSSGPANYYRIFGNPQDLAEATSQLFLGVRLQCAKCHHHPFEKYGQEDYYALAAFFARVGTKGGQEFGLFAGEQIVLVRNGGEVTHPRTGAVLPPTPLEGQPVAESPDRREQLAAWIVARDNKFFARNIVNRYCAYLLGRGLVEPVDDMRATNPATNEPLLAALAEDFAASGYDVKHLLRTILNSRLYQLSSQPTPDNRTDGRFYSHYLVKRIPAEALLDAVDRATGTQTKFRSLPLGTRATALPDSNYDDYFLTVFGKPKRTSVCECERSPDANLAQALHTLNGDTISNKISAGDGRIARLLTAQAPHEAIVTELYLATFSRRPTAEELALCQQLLTESPDPKTFYEDLLWSLVNSKQFLFVH